MATLDFTPAKQDLKLYKRDDAQYEMRFFDVQGVVIDLTGASGVAQVRNSLGALIGTLQILVVEANDAVRISILKEEYDTWKWVEGFYDLQMTFGNGDVKTILEGKIEIKGDRTYA